tara:strand:+ start:856 stop:1503 length:648 start_codon:yes stop_codon:yes gene_type:complete
VKIFIPIKENSQRVPRKNFRLINEAPLYKHVLYKLTDFEVYVDTDSHKIVEGIATDSKLQNVTVYEREKNLIGDEVSVCDLIDNFIRSQKIQDEHICQLHVTSPFVTTQMLKGAFDKLKEGYDSIVSCNKIQSRLWREETYGFAPINHNPIKLEQTQDLPTYYEENSIFYIFDVEQFLKTKMRVGFNPFFYTVDFPHNIDIDTEDDWELVERMTS